MKSCASSCSTPNGWTDCHTSLSASVRALPPPPAVPIHLPLRVARPPALNRLVSLHCLGLSSKNLCVFDICLVVCAFGGLRLGIPLLRLRWFGHRKLLIAALACVC